MAANTGLLDEKGIDWVCDRIASCKSITAVAQEIGCADSMLVMWLNSTPERSARAREVRSWTAWMWDERAEQAIMQANDPLAFQRARELASHYRWRASKIAPKIYGEKLQVEQDTTLHITVRRDDLDAIDVVAKEQQVIESVVNKHITMEVHKHGLIEGGVVRAGGDGVKGNPTSTTTSGVPVNLSSKSGFPIKESVESVSEEKPKKKRKSKGSWLHGGGVMLTPEEMEKDTNHD